MKNLIFFLCTMASISCQTDSLPSQSIVAGSFCWIFSPGIVPMNSTPVSNPSKICEDSTITYPNISVVLYEDDTRKKIIASQVLDKSSRFKFEIPEGNYFIDVIVIKTNKPIEPYKGMTFSGFPKMISVTKGTNIKLSLIVSALGV
jgi:hypothetical protein